MLSTGRPNSSAQGESPQPMWRVQFGCGILHEVRLSLTVSKVPVQIDLPGVSEDTYTDTRDRLDQALQLPEKLVKPRDAINAAFLHVLKESPGANASDLWHHVIYRLYCEILPHHRPQNPQQSWVRASGDALEGFVQAWYSPHTTPHGVRVEALISRDAKRRALIEMGLGSVVGDSKLDVALYVRMPGGGWAIFGGVHVKASLAERVSDDIPASRLMMQAGFFSPLWTFDVKSFPPPRGDLVNRGELGSPTAPSEKRKYVEVHGDFDACYSANSRTVPSSGATRSGKRVYTINLHHQPDQFVHDVLERAAEWRRTH